MISSCIATAVPANSRTRTREALGCLIVCRFMPPVVGRRCNGLRFAAGSGRCGRRPLRLVPRDGTVSRTRVTFADEGEQVAFSTVVARVTASWWVSGSPCADLLGKGRNSIYRSLRRQRPMPIFPSIWRWPGPPATVDTAEQKPVYQ